MQRRNGYTFIEMLITIGIFSLALVAIAAIFMGFSTAQSRASVSQRLLNEGNYLLESIAREARMNTIEYASPYFPDYLTLRTSDLQAIYFRLDGTNVQICRAYGESPCQNSGDWTVLNPSFMKVTAFNVSYAPDVDPLLPENYGKETKAYQPFVTIQLTVTAGNAKAKQTYQLQTGVSSRN